MADLTITNAIRADGGVFPARPKQCWWCKSLIYDGQNKEKESGHVFCSLDCKQDYVDNNKVLRYRKQLKVRVSKEVKEKKGRKEYDKQYAINNKEKKNENAKLAMRKYRARKVEQLKANKDN